MKTRFVFALITVLIGGATIGGAVLATPGSMVTSTPIAQGSVDPIDVKVRTDDWKSRIKTNRRSDLVVVENRVAPGGHFGWHRHPGPSLVIVKSGEATAYHGPGCPPQVYKQGTAFVEGGNVHIVRNEGPEPLVVVVTRLLPAGAQARIDEPEPSGCPGHGDDDDDD